MAYKSLIIGGRGGLLFESRTRNPKTTAQLIQNNVYCFLNITIFRLVIPAFFRFTDVNLIIFYSNEFYVTSRWAHIQGYIQDQGLLRGEAYKRQLKVLSFGAVAYVQPHPPPIDKGKTESGGGSGRLRLHVGYQSGGPFPHDIIVLFFYIFMQNISNRDSLSKQ